MPQAGVDKKDLDIALLRAQVDAQQRVLQEMPADLREMRLGKITSNGWQILHHVNVPISKLECPYPHYIQFFFFFSI